MPGSIASLSSPITFQSQKGQLQSLSFYIALAVNVIDQLWQFTLPIIVPYGTMLGADLHTIALFTSVRGLGGLLSNLWMPWFADGPKGAGQPRKRLAALASLAGCTLGYFAQGAASSFRRGTEASYVFAGGRFVTGFFSGMGPVISAYITELSQGDDELLRNRFKYLQLTNAALGLCLAPLAGVLVTFGLQLPFYVAMVSGVATLIIAYRCFKETSAVTQSHGSSTVGSSGAATEDSERQHVEGKVMVEGSPYCHAVVWLISAANACLTLIITGYSLLMPMLISQPSFGIQGETPAIRQQHIALITSLLQIPFSVAMILAVVLLFMPLSKRFGEIIPTLIGSILMACSIALMGFVTGSLGLIALLNFVNGVCLGAFSPGLLPMFARYVRRVFPTQQATAQGVPLIAGQLPILFSQNIMAAVITSFGVHMGSSYLGMLVVIFAISFCSACLIAHWSEPPKLVDAQENLLSSAEPKTDTTANPTLLTFQSVQKPPKSRV